MYRDVVSLVLICLLTPIQVFCIFKVKLSEKRKVLTLVFFSIILLWLGKWPVNLNGWLQLSLIGLLFTSFMGYESWKKKNLSYLTTAIAILFMAAIFFYLYLNKVSV